MAIDKALAQAPMGLTALPGTPAASLPGPQPVNDDEEDTDDGLEVEVAPDEDDPLLDSLLDDVQEERAEEFEENLAETLDDAEITEITGELVTEVEDDIMSRQEWVQVYIDGLELLGLQLEERTEPWEGACGVHHPLLSEALVKFQAETMMETFPAQGPVKTNIIGRETPEKRDAAARVREDMNYQLTKTMVEYRPEHERMLWGLGLAGNAFKKVYFDPNLDRQTSVYVTVEDVVVPYGASNLETAPRVTHILRKTENELNKLIDSGFYKDCELPEPVNTLDEIEEKIAEKMGFTVTSDERYKFYEVHTDLIIESDKFRGDTGKDVALPYVVTIDKDTQSVLAIRRNWKPEDKKRAKRNHFVHYSYVPGFGFYAFGLIHLIGAFAKSGTSLIRQLVDAGTLSNLPGGFKTKGLRVKGDDTPIGPGEWRDVDVASGTMRDNIMPLPYKEPSAVLFQLLQNIVEEGRKAVAATEMKVSDMSAQAPVGTTLAILERTLKVMSAIQARIHYAMQREFILLRDIIKDFTPDEYNYEPDEGSRKAKKSDYDLVEVIPVSDPNAATMAQKIVQYQAVIQLAQGAPQIYDLPQLHRQMLEVLGIKNAQKLVPLKDGDDMKPRDPVSENMDFLNGKPTKAFIYQDHEAHIAVHMAAMQDPKLQQIIGQSPNAQAIGGAFAAHIQEHLAFSYRKQVEEQAGVPLPPPGAEMDENTEIAVSRLAAAAAGQLLKKNQGEAAQQAAQQAAQDPIVQLQQKELDIKDREVAVKEKKLQMDGANLVDRQELDREKIASAEKIAGLQVGAKIATAKEQLSAQQQEAGLKLGVQIAKDADAQGAAQQGHAAGRQDAASAQQFKQMQHDAGREDVAAERDFKGLQHQAGREDAMANRELKANPPKVPPKTPPKKDSVS